MSDDESMQQETDGAYNDEEEYPQSDVEQPVNEEEANLSAEVKDEDDYEPPTKQTKPLEREASQTDQEDSFRRFEKLLAKTENFSRCLSAGDVLLCKD
jgi:hypothetical protein